MATKLGALRVGGALPVRVAVAPCIALLLAFVAAAELTIQAPGLPGPPAVEDLLREGIEAYASGDLAGADQVWARVREIYPEHPAAPVFEIQTLQARRALDWWNERYHAPIRERAEEGAALARAWLEREPGSARARLYLGQALLELMVIEGIHGKLYAAGVAGETARKHLERALEIDPELVDAKVPLGTIYYYAAIAGKYVKLVSWLWFVPKADRELGLAYLEEGRQGADLFRFDAALRLANAYMYVEGEPRRALPVLVDRVARYPRNSLLHFEIVELRLAAGDYLGTIAAAETLEQAVGDQFGDRERRSMARIWSARAELHLGRPDRTETLLAAVQSDWDDLTPWSRRWLLLTRANVLDLSGDRASAVSLYEQVASERARSSRSIELAREGLDAPFRLESVMPEISAAP